MNHKNRNDTILTIQKLVFGYKIVIEQREKIKFCLYIALLPSSRVLKLASPLRYLISEVFTGKTSKRI